jgi:hypothetical protein
MLIDATDNMAPNTKVLSPQKLTNSKTSKMNTRSATDPLPAREIRETPSYYDVKQRSEKHTRFGFTGAGAALNSIDKSTPSRIPRASLPGEAAKKVRPIRDMRASSLRVTDQNGSPNFTTGSDTGPQSTAQIVRKLERLSSFTSAFSDAESSSPADSPQSPIDIIHHRAGPDRQPKLRDQLPHSQGNIGSTTNESATYQSRESSRDLRGRRVKHLSNGIFSDEDIGLGVTSKLSISPNADRFLMGVEQADTDLFIERARFEQPSPSPVPRK